MGIKLKYGASPAMVMVAGYAAGRGKRAERDRNRADRMMVLQRRAMQRQQRLQYEHAWRLQGREDRFNLEERRIEAQDERAALHAEALIVRESTRAGTQAARDERMTDELWKRQKRGAAYQEEFRQRGAEDRRQLQEDEDREQGLRDGSLYYAPKQKERLDKLANDEATISMSNQGTPEERADRIQEIREERRAIKPFQTPADEKPPTPTEMWDDMMIGINPKTGRVAKEGEESVPGYINPKTGLPELLELPSSAKADKEAEAAKDKARTAQNKEAMGARDRVQGTRKEGDTKRVTATETINEMKYHRKFLDDVNRGLNPDEAAAAPGDDIGDKITGADASGQGAAAAPQPEPALTGLNAPPSVQTQDDLDRVPIGRVFRGPDGKLYRKTK